MIPILVTLSRWALLILTVTCGLTGCTHPATTGSSSGSGSSDYVFITGNWQFTATAKSGTAPFTMLSGFVNESSNEPGVNDFTTASFQVHSSTCYSGSSNLFLSGAVTGTHVGLSSFPVEDQVLTISASKDATATHISGNYSVVGGCADGATGTIVGELYAPMDGTYLGTSTGVLASTLQLTLSQYVQGTANGTTLVSGSALFQGISCFTKGTLSAPNGSVSGDQVNFIFTTNEPTSSTVTMSGTVDPAAQTIFLTSIEVTGGNCSGAIGATTLSLQ